MQAAREDCMSRMEDIGDELAREALDLEEQTGDEDVTKRIAEAIGSTSPTMEEEFLTALRIRRAERRARRMIDTFRRQAASSPN